nr:MAG TPA: major capsid protein [Caudoviricetes sp.]
MAFIQAPINYAKQYAQELANAYPYLSYFGEIYASPNNTAYRPVNAQTVLIPSMTTSGARAVNRNQITGTFNRNFNNNYEPKTMTMYREWDTVIDPMDIIETNDVATIANITRTFNEFQKVPEMDAYAASKCAGFASEFGGIDSTALSSTNILAQWDSYLEYMVNQRVNRDRVVCYVTPATYKLLKEAAGITRFIDSGTGIRDIDRNVGKLDGVTIKEVPSDMMMSAYDFTEGWTATAGAKQINMLLVDPLATVAPVIYDVSMITPPAANTKGKTVYYESYYYDVFALNQRQAGFFANMSAPGIGTVKVTSTAGASTGATVITYTGAQIDMNGNPYFGLDVYYTAGNAAATELTYNAALPSSATWTKCSGTNPVTLASQTAGKYVTVAVVNKQTGFVVAGGSAVEVVG